MRRLILCLALVSSASATAQFSPFGNSVVPRPPEPTAYGLEIIRAEQWHPGEDSDGGGSPPVSPESIERYRELIEQLEIAEGPYADGLAEALSGLAYNYQNLGKHQQAIDAFKRSIHLTRISRGPFVEEQIPLLDSLRESLFANRQLIELDRLQEYIYLVHRQALEPGDPRREQATSDYVEWQRSAYLQDLGDDGYRRLLTLHQLYDDALAALKEDEAPQSMQQPLLQGALQVAYLMALDSLGQQPEIQVQIHRSNIPGPVYNAERERLQLLRERSYRHGLRVAKDLVEASAEEAPTVRARALVAQGDWYQWQSHRGRAINTYTEAHALLDDEDELQRLFGEPTELPDNFVFLPGIELAQRTPRGRAQVRFTVDRHGRLRDMELLSLEPEGDRGAEIALRKMLRNLRFRPRLENGEAVETSAIEREYIFFDSP